MAIWLWPQDQRYVSPQPSPAEWSGLLRLGRGSRLREHHGSLALNLAEDSNGGKPVTLPARANGRLASFLPRLGDAPMLEWLGQGGGVAITASGLRANLGGAGHGATGCRRGRGHYRRSDRILSSPCRGAGHIARARTTRPQDLEQLLCLGECVFTHDKQLLRLRASQRRALSPPT